MGGHHYGSRGTASAQYGYDEMVQYALCAAVAQPHRASQASPPELGLHWHGATHRRIQYTVPWMYTNFNGLSRKSHAFLVFVLSIARGTTKSRTCRRDSESRTQARRLKRGRSKYRRKDLFGFEDPGFHERVLAVCSLPVVVVASVGLGWGRSEGRLDDLRQILTWLCIYVVYERAHARATVRVQNQNTKRFLVQTYITGLERRAL